MRKLIYTSYSPNTRFKDLTVNLGLLFTPWRWKSGVYPDKIRSVFSERLETPYIYTFNYARSAMYQLLRSMEIGEGDEVIVQAFTCVAAVNPIIWCGARPVFVDIDRDTLSANPARIFDKITNKTKMIVLQHTFGYPGDVEDIQKIARDKNIFLLEDCTQTVFGEYNAVDFSEHDTVKEKPAKTGEDENHDRKLRNDRVHGEFGDYLGTFGDGAIFSFGRDKPISGIDGGVLVLDKDFADENHLLIENIENNYESLSYPPTGWILRESVYAPIWYLIKKTFSLLKIGKLIHFFATKLGLLSRATSPDEKQGKKPDMIPARLPNSLARIAWEQLEDVDKINMHRKEISQIYIDAFDGDKHVKLIFENSKYPLLRFPLKVDDKNSLLSYLKNNNIYLGNWYEVPIAPKEVDPGVVGYELGACPNAEDTGADIVNLPTHVNIHVKEADKIIYHIKEFYELRY